MFWALYFGPYDLVKAIPVKAWFPGVSDKFAAQVNALGVQSVIDFAIVCGAFFSFSKASRLPGEPYTVVLVFLCVVAINYYLDYFAGARNSAKVLSAVSLLLHVAIIYVVFSNLR